MRAAIPALRREGGGSIINVASLHGPVGAPGYIASKDAVIATTKVAIARTRTRPHPHERHLPRTATTRTSNTKAMPQSTSPRSAAAPKDVLSGRLPRRRRAIYTSTGAELAIDGGYLAR